VQEKNASVRASRLVLALTERYNALQRAAVSRAGCSSEGNPGGEEDNALAYVFEPKLKVRTAREQRALILYVAREGLSEALYPFLLYLQERNARMKEPVFEVLNIAIEFLINRRLNPSQPIKEAVERILAYHPRSYLGNDLSVASEVLKRFNLKLRALSRSKACRSSLKRPKERAEPAHDWLPSWKAQYLPESSHFVEEVDPIWELLSPAEVSFHLGRQGRSQ